MVGRHPPIWTRATSSAILAAVRLTSPLLAVIATCLSTVARAEPVTVPADVGVGPAGYYISGLVADDQPFHGGLKISIQGIIDQATLRAHQDHIPTRYRQQALRMREVRMSPSIFIPDAIIVSPKLRNTGIYGVTWRPLSIRLSLVDAEAVHFVLSAGLLVTYAYLHSDLADLPATHFVRPGLDLGAEMEIALTSSFLISFGWASGFYVPQGLGTFGLGRFGEEQTWDALNQTLWHFGQAFIKLHFRFPYTTELE
jgi:hypothetical protein